MPLEAARAVMTARRHELIGRITELLHEWPSELTLEVGCGHGHFLTAYAQAHPDEHCLGIDILPERLARAERKAQRLQLRNVAFLRAEAGLLLESLPERFRWRNIFVLFPDPWPKRRHHKNRLLSESFLKRLAERAPRGARLYFRTDHTPYFAAARSVLQKSPAWRIVDEPWPFESTTVFQARAQAYHSCIAAPNSAANG